MRRAILISCLTVASLLVTGCVRRTITVTSDPPGALLWLNGREIGRTPVDTDFLYYGTYDVQLEKDGYEPLLTFSEAKAPWWDTIPLDLVSEITPGEKQSHITWHYQLQPRDDDAQALLERAKQARSMIGPPATAPAATQPAAP